MSVALSLAASTRALKSLPCMGAKAEPWVGLAAMLWRKPPPAAREVLCAYARSRIWHVNRFNHKVAVNKEAIARDKGGGKPGSPAYSLPARSGLTCPGHCRSSKGGGVRMGRHWLVQGVANVESKGLQVGMHLCKIISQHSMAKPHRAAKSRSWQARG